MTQRDQQHPWTGGTHNNCPSGKRAYTTRKNAKAEAYRIRRNQSNHMRPYYCDQCTLFHLAHLPPKVMSGAYSEKAWYGKRRRAS